ncbi:E3 SUMO-protein ligase pli1 [Coemansia sp. IMI 203386]|nr:E3 SUMO-protein ligase pli1 [Coemansia sp. IMI 203386]
MAKSKNLNFKIGLLEACLRSGRTFKQATAIEEKRKRDAERRAKKAAKLAEESGNPEEAKAILQKAADEEKAYMDDCLKKLEEFRLKRFHRKYHGTRIRMRSMIKKHLMMEKMRLSRLVKKIKAEKENPAPIKTREEILSTISPKLGEVNRRVNKALKKQKKLNDSKSVEETEALLEKVTKLDADFLVKVMEYLLVRRSATIRAVIGESVTTPEVVEAAADKYIKTFFNAPRIVNSLRNNVLDLETVLDGNQKHLRASQTRKMQANGIVNSARNMDFKDIAVEGKEGANGATFRLVPDPIATYVSRDKEVVWEKSLGKSKDAEGSDAEDSDSENSDSENSNAENSDAESGYDSVDSSNNDNNNARARHDKMDCDDSDVEKSEQEQEAAGSKRKSKKSDKKSSKKNRINYESYDEAEDEDFGAIYGTSKKGSKKAPKNRPGQQARRMMNAKIYGDDANHIKAAKRKQREILDKAKDVKGQKIVFEDVAACTHYEWRDKKHYNIPKNGPWTTLPNRPAVLFQAGSSTSNGHTSRKSTHKSGHSNSSTTHQNAMITVVSSTAFEGIKFADSDQVTPIKRLSPPVILKATNGRLLSTINEFKLPIDVIDMINDSTRGPDDGEYRIYWYMCTYSDACRFNTQTPQRPVEISYPSSFSLTLNSRSVPTTAVDGRSGIAPLDITDIVPKSSEVSNSMVVNYKVVSMFVGMAMLAKKQTIKSMIKDIRAKNAISADSVRKTFFKPSGADDDDIVSTGALVSLKCPLGLIRITMPTRSKYCQHSQCFDCENFLQMKQRVPSFKCPVCSIPIKSWRELILDCYFDDILKNTSDNDSQVYIEADGSWRPKEQMAVEDVDSWDINKRKLADVSSQGAIDLSDFSSGEELPVGRSKRHRSDVIDLTLDSDDDGGDGGGASFRNNRVVTDFSSDYSQDEELPPMTQEDIALIDSVVATSFPATESRMPQGPSVNEIPQYLPATSVSQNLSATSVPQNPSTTGVLQNPPATSVPQAPCVTGIPQSSSAASVSQNPSVTSAPEPALSTAGQPSGEISQRTRDPLPQPTMDTPAPQSSTPQAALLTTTPLSPQQTASSTSTLASMPITVEQQTTPTRQLPTFQELQRRASSTTGGWKLVDRRHNVLNTPKSVPARLVKNKSGLRPRIFDATVDRPSSRRASIGNPLSSPSSGRSSRISSELSRVMPSYTNIMRRMMARSASSMQLRSPAQNHPSTPTPISRTTVSAPSSIPNTVPRTNGSNGFVVAQTPIIGVSPTYASLFMNADLAANNAPTAESESISHTQGGAHPSA